MIQQKSLDLTHAQPVPTAAAYEIRVCYGANGWEAAGVFIQARSIIVANRIPGTVYDVPARAIGGSTGYSDWSDPVSNLAMELKLYLKRRS